MIISNLKELKQALDTIPEEKLETYEFCEFDDGIGIATTQGQEDESFEKHFEEDTKQHPELGLIIDYFDAIVEKTIKVYNEEDRDDEPVWVTDEPEEDD